VIAVVVSGLLAASKPAGWRITAWSSGGAAAILGAASLVWPELDGSLGRVAGAAALAWGCLFVAVAEGEARTTTGSPGSEQSGLASQDIEP
jgi:hypothetical protein